MNYNINKDNYHLFKEELYKLQDLKYRDFHSKLLPNNINLIGIRIPLLREISKNISKCDYNSFLENVKKDTYEEIMIHGLVIGYIKEPFDSIIKYLDEFLPLIDNWAINDTVVSNLKVFKNNLDLGFKLISKYLKGTTYYVRFGLVLLLDYYINDEYIDRVLKISFNLKSDEYYIKMANSWLISSCYIKYKDKTTNYLKNSKLDKFTHNMSIRKICDSYRVSKREKDNIKKYLKN